MVDVRLRERHRSGRKPHRRTLAGWRDRLLFAWWAARKDHLLFFAMLPLPFALLGCLIYAAHEDYGRIEGRRQRRADLLCLAENVYFEARGEPVAGQYAVAEVTMNRVASPLFPSTVCAVVHEKRWDRLRARYVGAFSWTELDSRPEPRGASWERALEVARAVYDGEHRPIVGGALYYHAKGATPSWARGQHPLATIGHHRFYR